MTNQKVSIIIPCYNAIEFLDETLKFVYSQTYEDLEVIIIDDGSSDGTLEYLETLTYKNLTVRSNIGKGACAARNYGVEISTGNYIQFLDADDLLSDDKIRQQVIRLRDQDYSIAVCNTMHFYDNFDDGKITDSDYLYTTSNTKSFLLNLYGANGRPNMIQTSAWLTPRKLIELAGKWDESLSKDQDGEFFCRVVSRAEKVIYVPNVTNYYRKHVLGKNISNQKLRIHLESQLKALESKYKELIALKDTKEFKSAFSLQYKWIAIEAYPKFKDISSLAIERSLALGGSDYLPVLGGKIIEMLKSIFGWRFAKSITSWIHKN